MIRHYAIPTITMCAPLQKLEENFDLLSKLTAFGSVKLEPQMQAKADE